MEILRQKAEVVMAHDKSESTVASMIGDFDAVINRNTKIDRTIIDKGKKLQVIACHSSGFDLVDVAYATEKGICVTHTPGANARSVAEFVVCLMLAMSRRLIEADQKQRIERDYSSRQNLRGSDLSERTVGIIGMGNIGKRLAKICCKGFDMKVLGYDPYTSASDLDSLGVKKVEDIFEIFRESDFVSLNCPLTEDVRGLVNKTTLKMMKKTAYLINCARGPIVNEADLGEALRAGVIQGAALDVFEIEPPSKDNPLFDAPNLIATPHMATMSYDSGDQMAIWSAESVLDVLQGIKPRFLANSTVWEQRKI